MHRTRLALLAALMLGTLGAGAIAWRHMDGLQAEVASLRARVEELDEQLSAAEDRARAAEARADGAESRAGEASQLAVRRRAEAEAATQLASVKSGEAEAARQAEAAAQAERQETMARAEQAFLEAERAKREAAELRRRREQDLDRLARALDRIAETRRTPDGLVANLGRSIEFDTDKAELRPANRETLARIAGILITAEDFGIQVYGHTDDVGNAAYNETLSERRARSVREYLVAAGVKPAQITATGMGESKPLAQGTSAAARQRNRRVEIALVHTAGEPALPSAETTAR
jgi:outer membrane protein OmpA-like peptidoglycan-associated protein